METKQQISRKRWSTSSEIEAIESGCRRARELGERFWNTHIGARAVISVETYRVAVERRAAMLRGSLPKVMLSRRADAEVAFAKLDLFYAGHIDWTSFGILCENLGLRRMSCEELLCTIRDLDQVGFGLVSMDRFVEWYMRLDTRQGHVSDKIWTHVMTKYTFLRRVVEHGREVSLAARRQQFFETKSVGSRQERASRIASRALKRYDVFLNSSRAGRESFRKMRKLIRHEKRLRLIARFVFSQCDPDALGLTSADKLARCLCFDDEFPLSGNAVSSQDFEKFFMTFKVSSISNRDISRRVRSCRLKLELKWVVNPKYRRVAEYKLRVRERKRSFVQALTVLEHGGDWVDAVYLL